MANLVNSPPEILPRRWNEQRCVCDTFAHSAVRVAVHNRRDNMAYVVKTIKGRRYRYQQTSRRMNGKVKSVSVYIGPVDPIYAGPGGPVRPKGSVRAWSGGLMRCIFERRRSLPDDAVMLAQYNAKVERDETK